MGLFKRKQEERADTDTKVSDSDANATAELLNALLGTTTMTREQAIDIPSVSAAINHIANTISSLPVKLYCEKNGVVTEITEDRRLFLLNHDTGDTLTATQFWKAMLKDYYLGKGAYAYINKDFTEFKSLHYVDNSHLSFLTNNNPIFKDYYICVNGVSYSKYDFLKILRNTKDGYKSTPIQEESKTMLSVAYHTMKLEEKIVKKGGNKGGFLKSSRAVADDAVAKVKKSFERFYSNDYEKVMLLTGGLEFQEMSNTSVEMQMNENKETNAKEILALFCVPVGVIRGNASKEDNDKYITDCIVPLLSDIEASLDRDMLTEKEKEQGYYYAFDTKELKRGNMKERYEAYEIAYKNNFMQIDEIREKEDMKPLGFEFIKLDLGCVLYNPKTGEVYTPNTDKTTNMDMTAKGGEET